MNSNTTRSLASIILPTWNQLEFTRQCIAALRRFTRPPWELIVIDNGSTDGTAAYLGGVQDASSVPVSVVGNTVNRGCPAAVNQGLEVARGDYLVLLNNDVVVTDAWLEQMVALANARTGEPVGAEGLETAPEVTAPTPPTPPSQGGESLRSRDLGVVAQNPGPPAPTRLSSSQAPSRGGEVMLGGTACWIHLAGGASAHDWPRRADVELRFAAAVR